MVARRLPASEHDEKRAIDRILRPAKWRGPKVLLNLFALLASPNEIEHAATDGMLGDIAGIAHLRECAHITGTGAA